MKQLNNSVISNLSQDRDPSWCVWCDSTDRCSTCDATDFGEGDCSTCDRDSEE